MKKKVKITVGGTEYTVVTHEEPEYTQKLAEEVDECIQDMCNNSVFRTAYSDLHFIFHVLHSLSNHDLTILYYIFVQ